jgi:hypothetical protein
LVTSALFGAVYVLSYLAIVIGILRVRGPIRTARILIEQSSGFRIADLRQRSPLTLRFLRDSEMAPPASHLQGQLRKLPE